jgi:hypothetical protein
MVRVGLIIILGDVRRRPKMHGVGARLDRCPKHHGAKVIRDRAPALSLRGTVLRLSMALGLDDVTDVMVIANLVPCRGTLRRKVTPLLLLRHGTLGPRPDRAVAGGVTAAPGHLCGVSIEAPPRWQ